MGHLEIKDAYKKSGGAYQLVYTGGHRLRGGSHRGNLIVESPVFF